MKCLKQVAFGLLLAMSGISPGMELKPIHADELLQKKTTAETQKPSEEKGTDTGQEQPGIDLKQKSLSQQLPIEPIIEEMKRAGQLIQNQQTGQETQNAQQQVVKNLEALISQLESAAPQPSSNSSSNNQDKQKQDKQKQSGQQQKQGMKQQQQQQDQLSQGPAKQSSDRNEQGRVTSGNPGGGTAYMKDAWGHLPPAMRQKLLNIYTEKFLPQYEDQVRRYYEALSEKKRNSP